MGAGMVRAGILVALACGLMAAPAAGATLEPVGPAGGYSSPVFVTSDPADPDRLFVVERGGAIQLTEGESTETFLDLGDIVQSDHGEEGLLSMAFAPDYADTGHFYVYFTNDDGNIEIDEFTAASGSVDSDTRRPVITIPHPGRGNHNGGQLQFGPHGYLYFATGDGGGAGDPDTNAQDLGSLLGKMLRIDPRDPDGDGPDSYGVPPDNPFVGVEGADEIWSFGLRNPFRFSFDRLTDALLIGDVGQGSREEVDYEPEPNAGRGDNFGWSCREGLIAYLDASPDPACAGLSGFTDPIHEYVNDDDNCAITGGYVVRDPSLGDLYGRYLYADFCKGELRALIPGLPRATCDLPVGVSVDNPSTFGEDSAGRIYVASLSTGEVHRLVGDTSLSCPEPPQAPPSDGGPDDPESPSEDPEPPDQAGADGDDAPPALRVRAPRRQELKRGGKLVCRLGVDEPSDAVVRLALVEKQKPDGANDRAPARGGKKTAVLRRFRLKERRLHPGVTKKVRWDVQRADVHAVRRASRDGGSVVARFRVSARDAAGNRTAGAELSSRLGA
jgi:glucose/arabinose dehydrogenase